MKIGRFPFKTEVLWSVERGLVNLGSKQPKCLHNKGKPKKTLSGLITRLGLKFGKMMNSWWRFRSFLFLFCSGEGKGEPEAPEWGAGGSAFFFENSRRGGSSV